MDKKTKGSFAELAVATRLMKDGWKVLFPYGENHRYDIVAEGEGRFLRIQVKYVTPRKRALVVNCNSSNNWSVLSYNPGEIDVIAAFNPDDGEIYFIPAKLINKTRFSLRLIKPKNNQIKDIHLAKDFKILTGYLKVAQGLDKI